VKRITLAENIEPQRSIRLGCKRRKRYFRPPLQAFIGFLRTQPFAARAKELGGYDVADAASVRHAP
jgi:hypothetical protein